MPLCEIHTNIPDEDIPEDFQEKLQRFVAKTLGKQLITIRITSGLRMCRGGSFVNRIVNVDLYGGFRDRDKNRQYSTDIFKFVSEELQVAEATIGVTLHLIPPTHTGTENKLISDRMDPARLKQLLEASS